MAEKRREPHILIVGAGLAGISVAVELKKQLGFENFSIYEKASTLGGTWRDNTYPGCGCDVACHWYSLSSELNPNWSSVYATQPEIRAYWEDIYDRHNLKAHTTFNTMVSGAEWSNDTQRYTVELTDANTGKITQVEAEVMFWAIGGFQKPVISNSMDLPGLDTFGGPMWHSARYNHGVELRGKRVGVIGNGCSGAQLVPKISEDPSVRVTNFCRTPQWYVPKEDYMYPAFVKWVFARLPFVMRWYRYSLAIRGDFSFLIFRKNNKRILALVRRMMTKYIISKAPKSEVARLTPSYPPGCRRIIVDPGYLECLHRPNVDLQWDGIEAVVENGIKLKTGQIVPLDIIIFATGFSLEPEDLRVRGSQGTTMKEYFDSQGGPTAYLGFPNLFVLLGPNVTSGSTSIIYSEEAQVRRTVQRNVISVATVAHSSRQIGLALKLIKPVLDGQLKSFEIKNEVTVQYNEWLQSRMQDSVWSSCDSYYHVDGNRKSKNIATFPGPATLLYWFARLKWEDWNVVETEKGSGRYKQRSTLEALLWSCIPLSLAVLLYKKLSVS